MKCQDFREIIDSYLCGELLTETNHEVLRHLEACANCRREIEVRRNLRLQLRSAVKNSPQYQMSDNFYSTLCIQLKQSVVPQKQAKPSFWLNPNSWLAFAAGLILTFGMSFLFIKTSPADISSSNVYSSETALINEEKVQNTTLADFAVGDHHNCAVKHNLTEHPVEIDLASAQYADLRQSVLKPLENAAGKYEFKESHNCKFAGHNFTHIVFRHNNKTVSVLITDLDNYPALRNSGIAKIVSNGYQIARFDVKDKAVFVVSDLPEKENLTTAEILETPMKEKLSVKNETSYTLAALAK